MDEVEIGADFRAHFGQQAAAVFPADRYGGAACRYSGHAGDLATVDAAGNERPLSIAANDEQSGCGKAPHRGAVSN